MRVYRRRGRCQALLPEGAGSPVFGCLRDDGDDDDTDNNDDDDDDDDDDNDDDYDDDDDCLHAPPSWRSQGQEHRPKWK